MSKRPVLVFVSPRFLFPTDEGGKIRTVQILRGMKGGHFEIVLLSPATLEQKQAYRDDLHSVCDQFVGWPAPTTGRLSKVLRLRHLFSPLPLSVATSKTEIAKRCIDEQLSHAPSLAVFDFAHMSILAPNDVSCPKLLFTHNVEAEIFARHARLTRNPVKRYVWSTQHCRMEAFEARELPRYDTVVAVSERDAQAFARIPGIRRVSVIPTGVDLDFFAYHPPTDDERIVFTGVMDWQANIDGVGFFMDKVWPLVAKRRPRVRMIVVGRNPDPELVERAGKRNLPWIFTGFVDDIRPYVQGAGVYVIPLRVGGGTRIKAYEAMAMGLPVVSTELGVEGLSIIPEEHYLRADSPREMADAIDRLLSDSACRLRLSQTARRHVEACCSSRTVAKRFEDICIQTYAYQQT